MVDNAKDMVQNGVHLYSSTDYIPPEDPVLQKRLEWFQDQKFALMIHFGLYNQLGMAASWPLSDEDKRWSRAQANWTEDDKKLRKRYFELNKSFNPVRLNPEEWAEMAKQSGFRYLILTTKHHDGFCLWDTKYTDYKVTAPDCPYHTDENPDIIRKMFDAFRDRGLSIGAYFSKADWHSQDFWDTSMLGDGSTDRNPTYDPAKYPEKWERFCQFCKNQILELIRDYGRIDILWLDGGWVSKAEGLDIDIPGIVDECRKIQPWMLSVDRIVGGPYENYITPEMTVPDKPMLVPWESCLTLGSDFDYRYDDHYKSARDIIRLLVDVVCKGGNLALNLSPQPDGRIPVGAVQSLQEIGQWLKTYGEAIYGTRICAPYKVGDVAFTQKDGTVYALRMYSEEKMVSVESEILIPYKEDVSEITLLDSGERVEFTRCDEGILVRVPMARRYGAAPIAMVFVLKK